MGGADRGLEVQEGGSRDRAERKEAGTSNKELSYRRSACDQQIVRKASKDWDWLALSARGQAE